MPNTLYVFRTRLGWMGLVTAGETVRQLTIGHATAAAARAALDPQELARAVRGGNGTPLVQRLKAYAEGSPRRFLRRPDRCRTGERVSTPGVEGMPTRTLWRHNQLRRSGRSGRVSRGGTGGRQLHGVKPDSADGAVPSGGMLGRPARCILRSRRGNDEAAALGDGDALSHFHKGFAINKLCGRGRRLSKFRTATRYF